jgi:hypothetical protein
MIQLRWFPVTLLFALALPMATQAAAESASAGSAAPHRVYGRLLDPREHPDYQRQAVKPPTWETFGNRTQFFSLRGFQVDEAKGMIVDYAKEIERYTRHYELGDVIWPSYPILFAKNLGDLAGEIKRRNLYLFDIWGYVPGSGPGGYWQQFKPSAEAFATLESKLGERWLGTDIGEQDGRYIGGYAAEMTPASAGRLEQYRNFQRHFERMSDDLGHKHATLVSLNFGHYFLKEGTYTLIGAETAQGLPNSQVYYAFIRGAGKQYGVPWFGNASIFNRWGWKRYGASGKDGYEFGPTKGTSLSLLKRLLYSHILYNSVAVGFENEWIDGDKLSPIGTIQHSAGRWVKEHGQPGVMVTPVALLLDFYAGWTFPRHLYSGDVYRVWGNLPYAQGDYLTDAVLDMLYPGYQNSSYFHDESGFLAPTPYGDIADCLLSDAPLWLLDRYPVVVAAGELSGGQEIRDKLLAYVDHGGHLVITEGNLAKLPGGRAAWAATPATNTSVVFRTGQLTVLPGDFGVDLKKDITAASLASKNDQPLAKPYVLRAEVRKTLDEIFRGQRLFGTDAGNLSLITCRKSPGEYTLSVTNNTWHELPLKIVSFCGPIESVRELPLDVSERNAPEYPPECVDASKLGHNTEKTIAGGDVRIFSVRVKESGVEEIAHVVPPARPRGRFLPLRRTRSIKDEILARSTFFEHFDGVVVDWRYLHDREQDTLRREAGWLGRQGLRIVVDLSSGLNLYPTLRLIDNDPKDYAASMAVIADVLRKMPALGSRDLILRVHRAPETNFTDAQMHAAVETTLRSLASQATEHHVTLHLRTGNLQTANRWLEKVDAKNLRIAASLAALDAGKPSAAVAAIVKQKLGFWLAAAPRKDVAGRLWDVHAPLFRFGDLAHMGRWTALVPDAPMVLDAVYDGPDEEYLDAVALERLSKPAASHP